MPDTVSHRSTNFGNVAQLQAGKF